MPIEPLLYFNQPIPQGTLQGLTQFRKNSASLNRPSSIAPHSIKLLAPAKRPPLTTFDCRGEDCLPQRLFKTLVWQTLGLVLCEKEDPVKGNIRGFWYNFVDPFYSKHNLYKEIRTDDPEYQLYLLDLEPEEITRQPEDLIKKHSTVKLTETTIQAFVFAKIFKYTGPFQFKDGNAGQSLVGRGTASIILFCEKDGLYELVHEAYDDHKISIFCSNGNPSSLSLEVFTDQLKAKKIENVALLGLVDYDPNGFIIAHDYKAKFEAYGFGIKNFSILTSLDLFTEKSLKDDSYSLEKVHPRKENQVQAWLLPDLCSRSLVIFVGFGTRFLKNTPKVGCCSKTSIKSRLLEQTRRGLTARLEAHQPTS